jgi:hypothetical protein
LSNHILVIWRNAHGFQDGITRGQHKVHDKSNSIIHFVELSHKSAIRFIAVRTKGKWN